MAPWRPSGCSLKVSVCQLRVLLCSSAPLVLLSFCLSWNNSRPNERQHLKPTSAHVHALTAPPPPPRPPSTQKHPNKSIVLKSRSFSVTVGQEPPQETRELPALEQAEALTEQPEALMEQAELHLLALLDFSLPG